ncbi:hypothetical protein ENBRE01_0678 [Enteropsectra breve]|nr:hypothetical protein ENBRE01_0678 [Enteropsectra breve]
MYLGSLVTLGLMCSGISANDDCCNKDLCIIDNGYKKTGSHKQLCITFKCLTGLIERYYLRNCTKEKVDKLPWFICYESPKVYKDVRTNVPLEAYNLFTSVLPLLPVNLVSEYHAKINCGDFFAAYLILEKVCTCERENCLSVILCGKNRICVEEKKVPGRINFVDFLSSSTESIVVGLVTKTMATAEYGNCDSCELTLPYEILDFANYLTLDLEVDLEVLTTLNAIVSCGFYGFNYINEYTSYYRKFIDSFECNKVCNCKDNDVLCTFLRLKFYSWFATTHMITVLRNSRTDFCKPIAESIKRCFTNTDKFFLLYAKMTDLIFK